MYTLTTRGPIEPGPKSLPQFSNFLNLVLLVLFLTKKKRNQKPGTTGGGAEPVTGPPTTSFFRRISRTFRWWLECNSLEKVGLHAGLYSGNNRPDLNRTPQALQSVFAPCGPVRHWGVFWTPQWLHRRGCDAEPPPLPSPSGEVLFFAFFSGGFVSEQHCSKCEEEEEEEEEDEVEDESAKEGDLSGQTRTPVLVRLLLALAGTGVLKQGVVENENRVSGSGAFAARFSVMVPVGNFSEKESSTK